MIKKQEIFLLIVCLISSIAVVSFNLLSSPAVYDRVKIEVKEEKTTIVSSQPESENISVNGKININTATKEDLLKIKFIGDKKAEAIIEYRKENGDFNTVEELKNVPGIGEKIYQKIKDKIEV